MNTHSITRPARTALLAATVAPFAVLLSLVTAQPASAAIAQNISGRPGAVSLNGPLITGRDIMYYNGYAGSYYTRTFSTAGVKVAPSRAYAGTQRVQGRYALQRWVNGGWQNVQFSGVYTGTVAGTGRLTIPAVSFSNPPQYIGRFAYRIRVSLVWTKASTGATIGMENVVSSNYSDNQCATRFISCQVYTDSIVM